MLIVVEGIDRVGKTTLCKTLSEMFCMNIWKEKLLTVETFDKVAVAEQMNAVIALHNNLSFDLILDRFHLSELVYGTLERGYANEYMVDIDRKLEDQAILIYVKSINIAASSKEHGKDLREYEKLFGVFYDLSAIKRKICVDFNCLMNAAIYVEELLSCMQY